jgi:hypothetical protein
MHVETTRLAAMSEKCSPEYGVLLMVAIGYVFLLKTSLRGVSRKLGDWYQKTNKTEDINKLTLLVFKIITILHSTLLATFTKLLETDSKGLSIAEPLSRVLGLPA